MVSQKKKKKKSKTSATFPQGGKGNQGERKKWYTKTEGNLEG